MRGYHFLNARYGLEDIRKRRLKISRLQDLNDPFELLGIELSDEGLRKQLLAFKQRESEDRGMLCFSRSWTNPVQWSHYADRHRGVCLGFEIHPSLPMRVDYTAKRLAKELMAGAMNRETMRRLLCTKYSHWKYEREERVFVSLEDKDRDLEGLYFQSFSPLFRLAEVIVGARSTVSRLDIEDALGGLAAEVTVFKARLAFGSFTVVRNKRESLWS
jgi:hypothetical protein